MQKWSQILVFNISFSCLSSDTLPRRDRRESDAKPPPIKRANSALSIRRSVNISTDPLTLPSPKKSETNTLRHSSITPTTPDTKSQKKTPIKSDKDGLTPKKTESEPVTSETRERSPSSEDDEPDSAKKEKSMKRRTHIVNEIITTEITYLKTLQTVVEVSFRRFQRKLTCRFICSLCALIVINIQ